MGASAVAVVSVSAGMMSMALFTDDAIVDNNAFTTGMVRHEGVDWNSVYTHARLVVDTVNSSASQLVKPGQVLRLGAGWS